MRAKGDLRTRLGRCNAQKRDDAHPNADAGAAIDVAAGVATAAVAVMSTATDIVVVAAATGMDAASVTAMAAAATAARGGSDANRQPTAYTVWAAISVQLHVLACLLDAMCAPARA